MAKPSPQQIALDFFQKKGLNTLHAAALVGNLDHESAGMQTTVLGDGGDSFGLAQWNKGRRKALEQFAKERGESVNNFDTQLEFVWHELTGSHKHALDKLQATSNITDATHAVNYHYEVSGDRVGNKEWQTRARQSRLNRAVTSLYSTPIFVPEDYQVMYQPEGGWKSTNDMTDSYINYLVSTGHFDGTQYSTEGIYDIERTDFYNDPFADYVPDQDNSNFDAIYDQLAKLELKVDKISLGTTKEESEIDKLHKEVQNERLQILKAYSNIYNQHLE